jgi:arylsulfatase A-like enzyme
MELIDAQWDVLAPVRQALPPTHPIQVRIGADEGLNPFVVRNTFVAWGADFNTSRRLDQPVSLADVAPTVLTVFGIDPPTGRGRGRVLRELLKDDRAPASPEPARRQLQTRARAYRASLDVSTTDGHDHVDSGSHDR